MWLWDQCVMVGVQGRFGSSFIVCTIKYLLHTTKKWRKFHVIKRKPVFVIGCKNNPTWIGLHVVPLFKPKITTINLVCSFLPTFLHRPSWRPSGVWTSCLACRFRLNSLIQAWKTIEMFPPGTPQQTSGILSDLMHSNILGYVLSLKWLCFFFQTKITQAEYMQSFDLF